MAPLARVGWRCSSFARAAVDSFLVLSAQVSANRSLKRRPAHLVVFALQILIVPTVMGLSHQ